MAEVSKHCDKVAASARAMMPCKRSLSLQLSLSSKADVCLVRSDISVLYSATSFLAMVRWCGALRRRAINLVW
jgi:hypothetical protein